jgi:hypothetical protein
VTVSDHSEQSFDEYRQILLWPLEIVQPESLDDLAKVATKIESFQYKGNDAQLVQPWHRLSDPWNRDTGDERDHYAEFLYFHPFVQRFLYPATGDREAGAFITLQRTDVARVRVTLGADVDHETETILHVDRVHLYLFSTQIAILVVEISSTGELPRSTVLELESQLRRAYPSHLIPRVGLGDFVGGDYPRRFAWLDRHGHEIRGLGKFDCDRREDFIGETRQTRRPPIAPHWKSLIEPLKPFAEAGREDIAVEQLVDDRIPSMIFLRHSDPAAITHGDLMRHCFLCGDGDEASSPYSPLFYPGSEFDGRFLYQRFWEPAASVGNRTLYMCCGYAFTALTAPGRPGDRIRSHFRHHYFQLGLLAHFHRASLLRFSRRFNLALPRNRRDERPGAIRELRREFARFVATSWFHEVSNQEQGRELFKWWTDHLGSVKLMKNIMTEVAAVDEVLELDRQKEMDLQNAILTRSQNKLARRVDKLTILLYVLTAATFIVAFLDSDTFRNMISGDGHYHDFMPMYDALGTIVLAAILFLLYRKVMKKKNNRGMEKRIERPG